MLHGCVNPVMDYANGIRAFYKCKTMVNVQLRAKHCCMVVYKLTLILGIIEDFSVLPCNSSWNIEIARLYNKTTCMIERCV